MVYIYILKKWSIFFYGIIQHLGSLMATRLRYLLILLNELRIVSMNGKVHVG